jgi:glycosyltransferase involved in cell wall biosynthesis
MMVSVLICTRNRAGHLRQTLASLAQVAVPEGARCEVIVADNGSSDDTAELVRSGQLPRMELRYLLEPRPGQVNARNAGLAACRGDIILFTDDDVRLPANWVAGMCAPVLLGRGQAVAGGVKIAPHLERPWMEPLHRCYLASTERLDPRAPEYLVGANMGFSRQVLSRVPAFDPELGPGALGFWDDVLFAYQVREASFTIAAALDVVVEHHFDESRLARASWIARAQQDGRSRAYVARHWEHQVAPDTWWGLARRRAGLAYRRLRRRRHWPHAEGIALWEYLDVQEIAFRRQCRVEAKRPANYGRLGLVRLSHPASPALAAKSA